MRADLDDLDDQALREHRLDRDRQREPRRWRGSVDYSRRRAFAAGVIDNLNDLAAGGVLQPPVKVDGDP